MRMLLIVAVLAASPALAATPAAVLAGDGIVVHGKVAKFGTTAQAQVIALVRPALGTPVKQGRYEDCGQGTPLGYARFRGGLELTFAGGKLSGWTSETAGTKTAKGIGVGATLAAVRKAYPATEVDPGDEVNGGFGPGFQSGSGPNGWLDGVAPTSKVTGLYAGATCIVG